MAYLIDGVKYNRIIWILDPGHGSNTRGKRSPVWSDGTQLFEWEFNRDIVARVYDKCIGIKDNYDHTDGVTIFTLTTTWGDEDITLQKRCDKANEIQDRNRDAICIFLSIHGDAFSNETAHGTTIFTSPGHTVSDILAMDFKRGMIKSTSKQDDLINLNALHKAPKPEETFDLFRPHTWKFRGNKDARFAVLTGTKMPALLLETGFYTNYIECKYMLSDKGRDEISDAIIGGMLEIQNKYKLMDKKNEFI